MGVYRGYIGIMEKKMETATWGLGFSFSGLGGCLGKSKSTIG